MDRSKIRIISAVLIAGAVLLGIGKRNLSTTRILSYQ